MTKTTVLAAVLAFLGAGCSSTPPNFYLIDPPVVRTSQATTISLVGLSDVSLPAYSRDDKLIRAVSEFELVRDDDHRWAEPPEDAVARSLARGIGLSLGANALVPPLVRGVQPDLRVTVRFDEFILGPDQRAHLAGQYILQMQGDERDPYIGSFSMMADLPSDDYHGFAAAVSRSLGDLSVEIADAARQLEQN